MGELDYWRDLKLSSVLLRLLSCTGSHGSFFVLLCFERFCSGSSKSS